MGLALVLGGAFLCVAGGVPGLFSRDIRPGRLFATGSSLLGSVLGLAGAVAALVTGRTEALVRPWPLPGAALSVQLDALSAVFLAPLFLVSGLGAVYGLRGFGDDGNGPEGRKMRFFYGLMTGAIALVLVAHNTLLFIAAWEVMALAGFFLVTTEWGKKESRDAGRLYLFATHVSTLALFALVAVLRTVTSSTEFTRIPAGVAASPIGNALFLLALVGFGLKAGLFPFHVWLPPAHAAAPSHVSALMSGVLIKTGIYGIVRVTSLVPDPPAWWGDTLLALGAGSAVLGVAFALGQHDLKRLLAWHSVENIGIIAMGLGLGLAGRAAGRPEWALLGFAGGLLHVVNHGLFKPLLFLGAGTAVHEAGTREMDRMGGLGRILPKTALLFLAGAVAISGLPPLNGFASEWLVYLGLLDGVRGAGPQVLRAALAVPALALTGALALACFVKAHGTVFLGHAREVRPLAPGENGHGELGENSGHGGRGGQSGQGGHAGRSGESPAVVLPMAVLAAVCAAIGLAPAALAPALANAVKVAAPGRLPAVPLSRLASLDAVGTAAAALVLALAVVAALLVLRTRTAAVEAGPTWDCGYAAPGARMQYTASSFAEGPVGYFRWVLLPRFKGSALDRLFPRAARFESHVPDIVLDRTVLPLFRAGAWVASRGRILQQGRIQLYIFYVGATLVALLFRV